MSKKQESPRLKELTSGVKKDIGMYSALEALKNSEGGQLITFTLKTDILDSINSICSKFKTLKHPELIALCAQLQANLILFRSISRSSSNKKMALQELDRILEENPEE